RIGRTSIATRWRFCGLPRSASCSENFVIPPDVFGQTLRLHAPVDQRTGAVVVPTGERELEIGHRTASGVGACCGWRKRMNGGRNKSGSALIAIGRKAKRGLAPRSQAAPLSTDTRRAWL